MKNIYKYTLYIIILSVAVFAGTACQAKEDKIARLVTPQGNEAALATQTEKTEDDVTTAVAENSPEVQKEPTLVDARSGVLRVAMQPVVQIDPAMVSSDSEVLLASQVYDYLVDVDVQSNITPRLAQEWTISEDGLKYTFTLVTGIKFHDGSPFTAKDVVWTFNRLRDASLDLPTTTLYSNIAKVEMGKNDNEVTFTLKQPNPFFLHDLSANQALILKEGTSYAATVFNGTGPFKVKDYMVEDRVILEANEDYFVKGLPKLSGMEILFFNDEAAMANALRSGQVDLMLRMGTDIFLSLQNQKGIKTVSVPANGFDLVRIRSDRKPGNDVRVVQALKLATDRDAIFQIVQQKYGAVGRDSPIGPMYSVYYNEETIMPKRNVEKARALLSEAGYKDGLKLDLHVPDTGNRPNLAAVLKSQWAEAGIDVNILVEPESIYYGENKWLDVDLGITGWSSRPYPQFYLDVMLKCDASWNEAHFCDKEFDELATLAGSTMDESKRKEAYRQIQRILIDRGPIIIPYFMANFAAIRDTFDGFALKGISGRTDMRTITVNQ